MFHEARLEGIVADRQLPTFGDDMGFLNVLRKDNRGLSEYVEKHIAEISCELEKVPSFFHEYTDHSVRHSERVLGISQQLVTEKLLDFEMALMILFSYYHDWGMVISEKEYKDYIDSIGDDTESQLLIENAGAREGVQDPDLETGKLLLALNHFRETHAGRSAERIRERFPNDEKSSWFQDGIYLWDVLAVLCHAHGRGIEDIIADRRISCCTSMSSGVTVDTAFLVALSRMADICHFSRDRALPFLRKGVSFMSRKSESIWEYYEDIAGTVPNPQTRRIEISAECKNHYIHRAIINNAKQIQDELLNSHRLLAEKQSRYSLDWKYVDTTGVLSAHNDYDYHDSRFSLKQRKVIDLLMGNRLYRNELYSLRECLQNALDAVKVFGREGSSHTPSIVVDVSQDRIVDVYDNGTGMDKEIVDKHFLSIGESAFWYSNRGIKEWGGTRQDERLIADHGIGALSYFMIADKIEVFSIYDRSQQHIHVVLDDYLDGVVFKNTAVADFPGFDPVEVGISPPWTSHHGTLVRMHLGRSIEPGEVLRFLATHVLRIHSNLFLKTAEGTFELPAIWHSRSGIDDRYYDFAKSQKQVVSSDQGQPSLAQVFSDLYEPKRGFYDNPPSDRALTDNEYHHQMSRYRILLHVDSPYGEPFRLSQNGITVEDAEGFFKGYGGTPLFKAFTVDVDVRGRCFQLNAERTQIRENVYNRQIGEELVQAFVHSYFEQVGKIEGSVYFPCGQHYYHGMEYILFQAESLRICFHQILKKVFQDEDRNRGYVVRHMQEFVKAKLYCVGLQRNRPISTKEIEADPSIEEVLVLRKSYLEKKPTLSDYTGEKDSGVVVFMDAVESHAINPDCIVYLPGNAKAFVLPLALRFDFSVAFENAEFRILKIHRRRGTDPSRNIGLLMGG